MRFLFTERAPDNVRFAPGSFDDNVGQPIKVNRGRRREDGTVIAATVAPDGLTVEIEVEVADNPDDH